MFQFTTEFWLSLFFGYVVFCFFFGRAAGSSLLFKRLELQSARVLGVLGLCGSAKGLRQLGGLPPESTPVRRDYHLPPHVPVGPPRSGS